MPGSALALVEGRRVFLSARWERLCLFNYAVPRAHLIPHVPPGLELDLWEHSAHVSLVAFEFIDTRVLGVPWPGFRNFPEINLRFYVREGERRGVAFIQELVPSPLVAWIARTLYNEPYRAVPMTSSWKKDTGALSVEHRVTLRNRSHTMAVTARPETEPPDLNPEAEFFKEHSWGYGTSLGGKLMRYEVQHPKWRTHPVVSHRLDWDFGLIYGRHWEFLNKLKPRSVYLAEGSPIVVSPLL